MKLFKIYCNGKDVGYAPFPTKQEALDHIQHIREHILKKSRHNPKYKESFEDLEKLEVVRLDDVTLEVVEISP